MSRKKRRLCEWDDAFEMVVGKGMFLDDDGQSPLVELEMRDGLRRPFVTEAQTIYPPKHFHSTFPVTFIDLHTLSLPICLFLTYGAS